MIENETVFNSLKGDTQDAIDKMVDAILLLRSLGLEPTGFTMDADTLYHFTSFCVTDEFVEKFVNSCGVLNLEEALSKYDFSIMGIPIEPDYCGLRCIKIRKKEQHE